MASRSRCVRSKYEATCRLGMIRAWPGNTGGRFTNNLHTTRQTAERTSLAFLAGQTVKILILIQFETGIALQTFERQTDMALIGVLAVDGMQAETFFLQITTYGKISFPTRRKQMGDLHQSLSLCIGFKHIEYINAQNGVELTFWQFGAVVAVITGDVIAHTVQFVGIIAKTATKVQNAPLQQMMLQQVACRCGKSGPLDGGQVGMVYFFGFHKISISRFQSPYSKQSVSSG